MNVVELLAKLCKDADLSAPTTVIVNALIAGWLKRFREASSAEKATMVDSIVAQARIYATSIGTAFKTEIVDTKDETLFEDVCVIAACRFPKEKVRDLVKEVIPIIMKSPEDSPPPAWLKRSLERIAAYAYG